MMTDERQGEGLFSALDALPEGGGIVFRHYSLAPEERRRLFLDVAETARRRELLLMLGGPPKLAESWGADGSHGIADGQRSPPHLIRSAAVHNLTELKAAETAGADFVFVSPVFPTRSHPGAPCLGPAGFAAIAREARVPVIALGGMNAGNFRELSDANAYGWAAIDAWSA
jgi:thiamine-phosphate pyrophosphorylase